MSLLLLFQAFVSGAAPSPDATVATGAGANIFTGGAPSPDSLAAPSSGLIAFTGSASSPDVTAAPGAGLVLFTGAAPSTGGPTPAAEYQYFARHRTRR